MTREDEDDTMLMALADGELRPEEAGRLLSRVAADPGLARRFELYVQSRALACAALEEEAGPVPDRLVQAILAAPSAQVIPLRRPRWQPLALAASLALAAGLGYLAHRPAPAGGLAVAAAALGRTASGGEVRLADGTTARALASFATDGGLCRMIEAGAERGIACRSGADWQAVASIATGEGFVPASEAGLMLLDGLLSDLGAGEPLEPAAEAKALGVGRD